MSGEGGPLGFGEDPPDEPRRGPRAGSSSRRPDAPAEHPADRETWLPGPPAGAPPRDRRSRLPGIVLMVAAFLLLVVVGVNTLRTEGGSSTGPAAGDELPPFAAPLALSDVEGDVNLARERDQGAAGRLPACEVRDAGVLTSCDLFRERPAVIAFFASGEQRCVRALDDLEDALRSRPGLAAAAVAVRGDRGDLRDTVRTAGWSFPVVHDRDGGLANVYGVAVCPQLTFVLPGGRVSDSSVGEIDEGELGERLDRLTRAARTSG